MTSIKRDDHKQQWESGSDTEIPLVCETCLGDNPFLRMTKEAHGKKCRICEVPFTVFAWQAGTKGRLKKVEICRSCARTKNVCQVCIFDLQYGLPVQVRDKVLAEYGGSSSGSTCVVVPPQSDANLSWFTQSQQRALENGSTNSNANTNIPLEAAAKLKRMARLEPRYERNLAKLCSFFARGECNRGAACPFRHEMPRDRNDPLSKQNTRDRFYGNNDPVARKMLRVAEERAAQRQAEYNNSSGGGGGTTTVMGTTVYCRFRDGGSGSNNGEVTESDVRDKFYSYGEIRSVRFSQDRASVFVEYTLRSAAQLAIAAVDKTHLKGRPVYCHWARAHKRGTVTTSTSAAKPLSVRPLLAPGGSNSNTTTPRRFVPVAPSAEVLAAGRAKRDAVVPRGGAIVGVPRPPKKLKPNAVPRPYYPSADPGRLGSRTTTNAANNTNATATNT